LAEFLGGQYTLAPGSPWCRFAECLPAVDKPLIAGVQGHAVGIGLTMLLHADIVILCRTARLSAPFAQLGLVPEVASSRLLPSRIWRAKANEIFLLGKALDASEAKRLGLANSVVEAGTASEEALKIGAQIAALPSVSVAHIKRLGRLPCDSDRERIAAECDAFMECVASEGTRAILSGLGRSQRA
jgi:enoyl-CoA hydratase/carnithine racemase